MIRGLIEGSVLLAGWLLGAKVGLGTIIAAFGISTILQLTFNWLHFDAKSVQHEGIWQTLGIKIKILRVAVTLNWPLFLFIFRFLHIFVYSIKNSKKFSTWLLK